MKQFMFRTAGAAALGGALAAGPLLAQQSTIDNTGFGTTSAEFLMLGAGARGAALGGAFATIADDVTALYWNPGGVALMERPGAAFSTYEYIADTRYSWVGLAFPLGGGERAIGIHGATFGFTDQPVYTFESPDGDGSTYRVTQTYLGLTYSQNFSDRFSAGITGKYVSDRLGETAGTAFAVDFGTNFHASVGNRPVRASFTIQNLGTDLKHDGSGLAANIVRDSIDQSSIPQEPQPARLRTKEFQLPVLFRFGVAFDFVNTVSSRVTVMSEFNQPNNASATGGGAVEWALNVGSGFGVLARGGYTYQSDNGLTPDATVAGFSSDLNDDENLDGLSFGGGIMYHRNGGFGVSLDYAYRNLGILGGTNYFSASVSW